MTRNVHYAAVAYRRSGAAVVAAGDDRRVAEFARGCRPPAI